MAKLRRSTTGCTRGTLVGPGGARADKADTGAQRDALAARVVAILQSLPGPETWPSIPQDARARFSQPRRPAAALTALPAPRRSAPRTPTRPGLSSVECLGHPSPAGASATCTRVALGQRPGAVAFSAEVRPWRTQLRLAALPRPASAQVARRRHGSPKRTRSPPSPVWGSLDGRMARPASEPPPYVCVIVPPRMATERQTRRELTYLQPGWALANVVHRQVISCDGWGILSFAAGSTRLPNDSSGLNRPLEPFRAITA